MIRWKARGRLPISGNRIFYRQLSRLRRYERILVEIVVFKRVVVVNLKTQISWEMGGRPPTTSATES